MAEFELSPRCSMHASPANGTRNIRTGQWPIKVWMNTNYGSDTSNALSIGSGYGWLCQCGCGISKTAFPSATTSIFNDSICFPEPDYRVSCSGLVCQHRRNRRVAFLEHLFRSESRFFRFALGCACLPAESFGKKRSHCDQYLDDRGHVSPGDGDTRNARGQHFYHVDIQLFTVLLIAFGRTDNNLPGFCRRSHAPGLTRRTCRPIALYRRSACYIRSLGPGEP